MGVVNELGIFRRNPLSVPQILVRSWRHRDEDRREVCIQCFTDGVYLSAVWFRPTDIKAGQ